MTNSSIIESKIKEVPDFPKPGINFLDISPLFNDHKNFKLLIDSLEESLQKVDFESFIAIESRGFILGSALSYKMQKGMVMVRKPGKLPRSTPNEIAFKEYSLEYGTDRLEIIKSNIKSQQKVIIVDDVLATGGTARAALELCQSLEAKVQGFLFLIELSFLNGREKLNSIPIHSLITK